jgi:hypothetical protein
VLTDEPITRVKEPLDPFTKVALDAQRVSCAESLTAPIVVLTELNAEGQLGAIVQLDEARAIEASSSIQGAYEICKKPTQVIYNKEKGPN